MKISTVVTEIAEIDHTWCSLSGTRQCLELTSSNIFKETDSEYLAFFQNGQPDKLKQLHTQLITLQELTHY